MAAEWISGNPTKDGLYVGEWSNGCGLVVVVIRNEKMYYVSGEDVKSFQGRYEPVDRLAFKRHYEIPKPPELDCRKNREDIYVSNSIYTEQKYTTM